MRVQEQWDVHLVALSSDSKKHTSRGASLPPPSHDQHLEPAGLSADPANQGGAQSMSHWYSDGLGVGYILGRGHLRGRQSPVAHLTALDRVGVVQGHR